MPPAKSFVIRLAIYSVGLLYLALDLFVFDGPLNRRIQAARPDSPEAIAHAKSRGVVARVLGHPIYRSQVERAARECLWFEGRRIGDLEADEAEAVRRAALNDLIDHRLLRFKVQYNAKEHPVDDREIDAAMTRFASRFTSRAEMGAELAAAGIDGEKEMRMRLGARIQQEKYLESRIAADIAVTESEAREWFEAHADALANPPRVRARHVFLATLDRDADEARAALADALARLERGERDFDSLARELSDDPRTRERGGDLGWMTAERLPEDFAAPVFAAAVGEPRLVRTKLGWHLLEVTARRARERRSFDEARGEVFAALESAKRRDRVRAWRRALRKQESENVRILVNTLSLP